MFKQMTGKSFFMGIIVFFTFTRTIIPLTNTNWIPFYSNELERIQIPRMQGRG
jgi:hypothetical protein